VSTNWRHFERQYKCSFSASLRFTSSARFKEDINPMDDESDAIHSLKPVIFRYKRGVRSQLHSTVWTRSRGSSKGESRSRRCDEPGKPFTVRYEVVNAMLLNEFVKEHRTVQNLNAVAAQQQKAN
jgi:hypothetical protein